MLNAERWTLNAVQCLTRMKYRFCSMKPDISFIVNIFFRYCRSNFSSLSHSPHRITLITLYGDWKFHFAEKYDWNVNWLYHNFVLDKSIEYYICICKWNWLVNREWSDSNTSEYKVLKCIFHVRMWIANFMKLNRMHIECSMRIMFQSILYEPLIESSQHSIFNYSNILYSTKCMKNLNQMKCKKSRFFPFRCHFPSE